MQMPVLKEVLDALNIPRYEPVSYTHLKGNFLYAGLSLLVEILVPGFQQGAQIPAGKGGLVNGMPRVFPELVNDLPALRSPDAVRDRELLPLLG